MTTSFNQARADFLLLAQSDGVSSKDVWQKRLDNVTKTFNEANGDAQQASKAEMVKITAVAAEIGLPKPKLLAKTLV